MLRVAVEIPERDERSITIAQAADRLGCDHTTIRELLRKGLLAGVRIGKTDKPTGVRIKLIGAKPPKDRAVSAMWWR